MINKGISFAFWQNIPWWIVALFLLVVVVFLVFERQKLAKLALIFIVTGGMFNLWQRLLYGGVVDNLSFFGLLYNNLADYLIMFGLFLYGYTSFVRRR